MKSPNMRFLSITLLICGTFSYLLAQPIHETVKSLTKVASLAKVAQSTVGNKDSTFLKEPVILKKIISSATSHAKDSMPSNGNFTLDVANIIKRISELKIRNLPFHNLPYLQKGIGDIQIGVSDIGVGIKGFVDEILCRNTTKKKAALHPKFLLVRMPSLKPSTSKSFPKVAGNVTSMLGTLFKRLPIVKQTLPGVTGKNATYQPGTSTGRILSGIGKGLSSISDSLIGTTSALIEIRKSCHGLATAMEELGQAISDLGKAQSQIKPTMTAKLNPLKFFKTSASTPLTKSLSEVNFILSKIGGRLSHSGLAMPKLGKSMSSTFQGGINMVKTIKSFKKGKGQKKKNISMKIFSTLDLIFGIMDLVKGITDFFKSKKGLSVEVTYLKNGLESIGTGVKGVVRGVYSMIKSMTVTPKNSTDAPEKKQDGQIKNKNKFH